MPELPSKLRAILFNRYTAFALFMVAYTKGLELAGGLASLLDHPAIEGPLLLYLYYLFNAVLKQRRWTPYLAALPIVAAYGLYDGYYLAFGDVFRIADFHELPELLQVLPWPHAALLLAALGLPLLAIAAGFDYRRNFAKGGRVLAGSMPAILLAAHTQVMPDGFLREFKTVGDEVVWSGAWSVKGNGRLAMLMYYEAQRNSALARSATYRDREQYARDAQALAEALRSHMRPRHVHLVVLESFLDPTLFGDVRYTRDPRHPDYLALFGDRLGYSLSPVFGGGTAQAEFEALCGVPAFEAVSSIEFNAFTGAPAYCLPGILRQAGYRAIASNGYKPNFFNAIKAYRGVGFGEAYFPAEYAPQRATYLSVRDVAPDEEFLFDASLFEQNLAFVSEALRQEPERPLLNYVLSMYGHLPHTMNPRLRPQVLEMRSAHKDDQLLLAANQHYYRTQAIASFVRKLMLLDPDGLIILVSDHLPPLDHGTASYRKLRYLDNIEDSTAYNRIVVIEHGKPVRYRTLHHYDIPSLIYNYLTDGWYCTHNDCNLVRPIRERADYYASYMRMIANAVDQNPLPAAPVEAGPVRKTPGSA